MHGVTMLFSATDAVDVQDWSELQVFNVPSGKSLYESEQNLAWWCIFVLFLCIDFW